MQRKILFTYTPQTWHLLFITICIAYFAGMLLHNNLLQYIFKPLLVSSILGYFISAAKAAQSALKRWVVLALLFSIAGDVLLMFTNVSELYFVAGLVCFLCVHIFYIIFFHSIRMQQRITGNWYTAIILGINYFIMMDILLPHMSDLKYPVIVYGMVISFMLLVALHLTNLKDRRTAQYIIVGAILFILSDSALAINKFYYPFPWGSWAIMASYVLAQWLIVKGAVRYIVQD